MFKFITLGLFAVSLAYSYAERTLVAPDPEIAEKIRQSIVDCSHNPDIDDVLKMAKEGTYRDEPDYHKLVHCSFLTTGFCRKDGSVIIEKALELFRGKEALVLPIFNKCSKEGGSDPVARTFGFYKCFQDESPCLLNLDKQEN